MPFFKIHFFNVMNAVVTNSAKIKNATLPNLCYFVLNLLPEKLSKLFPQLGREIKSQELVVDREVLFAK